MRPRSRRSMYLVLLAALALLAASCGSSDDDSSDAVSDGAEAATDAADDDGSEDAADDADDGATADEEAADDAASDAEAMDFGEPVTLTLGHPFPEQHPIAQNALLPYAEAVNEATGGAVTIEFAAGGSLAAPPATFENTVAGGQDLGWALQGYHAGLFPATEVVEQPFQFESAVQATNTLWDLYDEFPELQEEYSDVALLGLWVHDIGDLWTKDQPVQTLEDMEGLTLRFPTPVIGRVMEAMGASTVGMPAPQIFDSLNTGVIDGLMIAVSGLASFQLYPELAHGTECNCYVATQYLVMNLDQWNELTPDTQAVLRDLGREHSLLAAEVYDGLYDRVSAIAVEEGIEKYVLPADELARWQEVGGQVTDEWIAEREGEGIPAQAMYDRMQEIKAEHGG